MTRNKYPYLVIILFLGLLIFQSCKGRKASVLKINNNNSAANSILSNEKQAMFEKNFFEGEKEKLLGNFVRAQVFFLQALKINPISGAANYEVGTMYFNRADLKNAESFIEQASKLEPKNKWYKLLLADIYSNQKKYEKSVVVYDELIDLFPNDIEYYEAQAGLYQALKKPAEALKVFDKMETQFGVTTEIIFAKKKLNLALGKFDQAEIEINKLLKIDPMDKQALKDLGNVYLQAGKKEKALAIYKRIDSLYPGDGYAQLGQAEFYLINGDKNNAQLYLKKAFESSDIAIDNKIQIVIEMFLRSKKDSIDLINGEVLTKILVKNYESDPRPYLILAESYYNQKRYEESIVNYNLYIQRNPKESGVWVQLISAHLQLKDYASMEATCKKALELFPNQSNFYFYMGLAQMEMKKLEEALTSFKTGVELTYNNNSLEALFYTNIAEAQQRLNRYEDSYISYENALNADPKNAMAMNNYAYLLITQNKKIAKAEEMSKKSLELEPENESFLDTYGWILFLKGNYPESEKYLKKAMIANPTNAEVLEHYGDVQFKLGQITEAISYWQQAKMNGSESKELLRKIAEKKL